MGTYKCTVSTHVLATSNVHVRQGARQFIIIDSPTRCVLKDTRVEVSVARLRDLIVSQSVATTCG